MFFDRQIGATALLLTFLGCQEQTQQLGALASGEPMTCQQILNPVERALHPDGFTYEQAMKCRTEQDELNQKLVQSLTGQGPCTSSHSNADTLAYELMLDEKAQQRQMFGQTSLGRCPKSS